MTSRWHLLLVLLGAVAMLLWSLWPTPVIWKEEREGIVQLGMIYRQRKQWLALCCDSNKSNWVVEARQGRSDEVMRRLPLQLPAMHGRHQYVLGSDAQASYLFFRDTFTFNRNDENQDWVIDGRTGESIFSGGFAALPFERVALQGDRLAVSVGDSSLPGTR